MVPKPPVDVRHRVRRDPAALLAAAVVWSAVGCGDEGPGTLRLKIDSSLRVPDDLDEVRVIVTAARSEGGPLCVPTQRSIPLVRQSDFPLYVGIEVGQEYRSWVAFRIEGRLAGDVVIFQESQTVWPGSGTTDVNVQLAAGCYRHPCASGEMCLGSGVCVGVPVPGAFDDGTLWDPGVPCDRAAPVLDADGDSGGDIG